MPRARSIARVVGAVRAAVPAAMPVSAKMRLGFNDTALMTECAQAMQAGGACEIVVHARTKLDGYRPPAYWDMIDLFQFWPEPSWHEILFFFGAAITMMLGSIPQQDVFQRVMSAHSEKAATRGTVIGGSAYIFFAFVPMFLVASALIDQGPRQAHALQPSADARRTAATG